MAHKHLHELLSEDQEPFQLKNYIADRRCQLKKPPLHLKKPKPKPIIETSTSRRSLCKQACFFSFQDSPDVKKSPFLDFPSPAKSPCKSPNKVFLQIPARTAAMLLEAAMRIQKQSSSKPKSQIKNISFGLFGSILKRLRDKNRTKNLEIGAAAEVMSEKVDEKNVNEMGFSCSFSHSRLSSGSWSERNEEKDIETSSCCRSEESQEIEFVDKQHFCSSPLSPFRFSLQKSTSPSNHTPEFLSPATSPCRQGKEEVGNYEGVQNIQLEEEEEKEQCSPVSVLDPPFEDRDGHEGEEEEEIDDEDDGDYDLECSYKIVQKAKLQLLHKLRRFERLAELDPIELEKRMLEDQDDESYGDYPIEDEEYDDDESLSLCSEENLDDFVRDVFCKSSFQHLSKIPSDMKMLVSDLIVEEKKNLVNDSEVVKGVLKKLESWREVESNTIDMMIDLDFKREIDGWKRKDEDQIRATAIEIELGIFRILVEELCEELVSLAGL